MSGWSSCTGLQAFQDFLPLFFFLGLLHQKAEFDLLFETGKNKVFPLLNQPADEFGSDNKLPGRIPDRELFNRAEQRLCAVLDGQGQKVYHWPRWFLQFFRQIPTGWLLQPVQIVADKQRVSNSQLLPDWLLRELPFVPLFGSQYHSPWGPSIRLLGGKSNTAWFGVRAFPQQIAAEVPQVQGGAKELKGGVPDLPRVAALPTNPNA